MDELKIGSTIDSIEETLRGCRLSRGAHESLYEKVMHLIGAIDTAARVDRSDSVLPKVNSYPPMPKCKEPKKEHVEHPSHYNAIPNWEVIDTIQRDLSSEEYVGFLKGNILKYRLRAGHKGDALQDIAKADYYKNLLIEFLKVKELLDIPMTGKCSILED